MPDDLPPERLIALLGLRPHPEGGFFAETWRSDEALDAEALPARYAGARSHGTAIHYLLTPESFSTLHRLASDEIYHFYAGDAVGMLQLHADGRAEPIVIGPDLEAGQRPQVVVPRGTWHGSRLLPGGRFALLGCTVSPGFDFADFEAGRREVLVEAYPDHADVIRALTR